MKQKVFKFWFVFILNSLFLCTTVSAQWSGKYGNEWINYDSKYLKINVIEAGLYKIPLSLLPLGFPKDPKTLQLWHRGNEVALVHADDKEIWFYAELNDGQSDSLLFRPASARMNQHQSFFSDQGVYFLTNGINPKRAVQVDKIPVDGNAETHSLRTEVVSLRDQFSFATLTNTPSVHNNSYFEGINSWTGPVVYGDSAVGRNSTNVVSSHNFALTNYQTGTGFYPVLNIMLNGLHYGRHDVQIAVGKSNKSTDLSLLTTVNFTGLGGIKREGLVLKEDQFSPENGGVLTLRSRTSDIYDWFSLTYYSLTYPEKLKMTVGKSSYFNFQPAISKVSRVSIETVSDKTFVLDITNSHEPKLLSGVLSGTNLELMIPRIEKSKLRLFSTSTDLIKVISADAISTVDFRPLFTSSSSSAGSNVVSPSTFDYLIITSDTLRNAAIEYAKYRCSEEGGSYKTVLYDAKNLYNQFNYGEPSPVAIKRFVDFMLKNGIRENHNLLLIGIGISTPDAPGRRLIKDFPHDVPTIGDPGSDVLLVSGLHGLGPDVPAIPVGRISAFNQRHVLDYLDKVKEFESDKSDKRWQKKILHLNGGKTSSEINQLKTILSNLDPLVVNGNFGGEVKAFVKQTTIETEKVDISKEVNEGVGMISYFGHGSPLVTDLDMGKASDLSRNYNNRGKYPLMYFNGCGVGNIYSGRSVLALSADWVLSPKVGAIAVIANSFNSYVSPTSKQMKILYEELFVNNSSKNITIGRIAQNVALKTLSSSPDNYDITNIHQSNLQGDPAIRLFSFTEPDYSFDSDRPLIIQGESGILGEANIVRVGVNLENYGRYVQGQNVPLEITYTYKNGLTNSKMEYFDSFASKATVFFNLPSDARSLARIEVGIDPFKTIEEINQFNNSAELNIDWSIANRLNVYPDGAVKDIVVPTLTVTVNERTLVNEEVLLTNPVLNITLSDDNSLSPVSTLFEVYLKPCWGDNCDYIKINLDSAKVLSVTDRVVLLNLLVRDLKVGLYEILVSGKDKAGNSASVSYNLRFEIREAVSPDIILIASPNPASEYIRFDMSTEESVETINYTIYNVSGIKVSSSDIDVKYPGNQSWYWFRNGNPSGLYYYKAEVNIQGKKPFVLTGKIALL